MRIVVLVKEVPDTFGERKVSLETGLTDREACDPVLDEICERAVQAALTLAGTAGEHSVHLMSMSPESAASSIRKGLAMGAESVVHICDPALLGADLSLTAEVLAKAIEKEGFDLVIAGNLSTDGNGGMVPAMIAEWLDRPHLTHLSALEATETTVSGTRAGDDGDSQVTAELPAVVSITEAFPDARFPNFKGIMAAKKKPFGTLTLADLGIDAQDFSIPRAIMTEVAERPPRAAGVKVTDDGTAAAQLADYLAQNKLI
ncbi:electron transfer flavoprotein subunit beta/FixA family protein [Corynebacterium vitaeruminis]|uniref:electron transfer flavoprotein subunit beta/FixA family protein n=1 Tax=Corynebacterium vitaeruminis TaxID=38305 RepID=UPI0023EFC240|nr:electron transfer flavoprotein subunit beta/FixA family protein [Corynebacterium vitaeruminis]